MTRAEEVAKILRHYYQSSVHAGACFLEKEVPGILSSLPEFQEGMIHVSQIEWNGLQETMKQVVKDNDVLRVQVRPGQELTKHDVYRAYVAARCGEKFHQDVADALNKIRAPNLFNIRW